MPSRHGKFALHGAKPEHDDQYRQRKLQQDGDEDREADERQPAAAQGSPGAARNPAPPTRLWIERGERATGEQASPD